MAFLSRAGAELGDAVGGAPAGRGFAAVEQRGDVGVGQVGEVAVDDGAALLEGKGVEGGQELLVALDRPVVGGLVVGGPLGQPVGRVGPAGRPRSWSMALRWAMVTSQARTLLSGRSCG